MVDNDHLFAPLGGVRYLDRVRAGRDNGWDCRHTVGRRSVRCGRCSRRGQVDLNPALSDGVAARILAVWTAGVTGGCNSR